MEAKFLIVFFLVFDVCVRITFLYDFFWEIVLDFVVLMTSQFSPIACLRTSHSFFPLRMYAKVR